MQFILPLLIATTLYSCTYAEASCEVDETPWQRKLALKDLEIFLLKADQGITSWLEQKAANSPQKMAYQKQVTEVYPALKQKLKDIFPANRQNELAQIFRSVDELLLLQKNEITSKLTTFEDYETPMVYLPAQELVTEIHTTANNLIEKVHKLE